VGIGAGGPHIADESWELDCDCDSVLWCDILERGVDLGGVSLPKVLTSLHILLTLNVTSLLCLSLLQPE
jgi:hypothetical protein